MNGITYYRLKSDYPGDYTKNCALNGTEVDNNFYVLEGRDVKSIAVKGKDIIVTLLNGNTVMATDVLDFVKPEDVKTSVVKVEFDKLNGVLKLTLADGTIQHVEGFATNENTDFSVATDNTICGDGLRNAPLGVAPSARTGQYKTVKAIINVATGGSLPSCGVLPGDRFVTCEDISDFGYLYDYRAVREIACQLKKSGWRIPTKADWDDLLNAIEPCDCDKTHDKSDRNKVLGRWAGKLLKSKTMWVNCDCGDCDDCDCDDCHHHHHDCHPHHHHHHDCDCNDECGKDTCFDYTDDPCYGTKECEQDVKCHPHHHGEHRGLDAYGFRVTPAGYADDGCNYSYFKERSTFWTATTNQDNTKAYIKRFQFNKDGVYQDVIPSNYHLSLRLVKDYNGKNYFDTEEIMDMEYPTLLLPSVSKGKSIWTACNVACGNASLSPMLPNNGQSLTYTRHYFINEWDGFRWVRNEMKQGETVTVVKAPKGKEMVEYRVVGNDFISVNEMIYTDVMNDVTTVIDNLETKLTDRIELAEKEIDTEREERKSGDEILQNQLEREAVIRQLKDDELQQSVDHLESKTDKTNEDLATVNTNMVSAINTINDAISTVNKNLYDAINTINGGIAAEIQERKDADAEEKEARIAADEALQKQSDERYAELVEKTDKTNEELGKTNQTLTDFAAETNKAFGIINEVIKTSVDTINQSIMNETDARIKADEEEKEARIAADEAEAKAREEADAAEAAAREAKDNELEEALNKEISDREAADAKEEQERKENDEEIRGTILTQEGTEFNSDNGVLTLKSKDATNDITVQFSFNFGTFVD